MLEEAGIMEDELDTAPDKLTTLQASLEPRHYSRNLHAIYSLFSQTGVDLKKEVNRAIRTSPKTESFVILDNGCGSGDALQEMLDTLPIEHRPRALGIGVDLNPLPSPAVKEGMFGDDKGKVILLSGDVSRLPIAEKSVDFGYSAATMQYVKEGLKALEEGYRILKEGGTMLWRLNDFDDISASHMLYDIFDNTPGANEIFKIKVAESGQCLLTIICTKDSSSEFKGFPYNVTYRRRPVSAIFSRNARHRWLEFHVQRSTSEKIRRCTSA